MDVLMNVLNLVHSVDGLLGDDHDAWCVVLILLLGGDVIHSHAV